MIKMLKPYITSDNMVFTGASYPDDPVQGVYFQDADGIHEPCFAVFHSEPPYNIQPPHVTANARLFILAPEIFELLKDLLPEFILVEAGEPAHLDVGRIEAVGPYTRDLVMGSFTNDSVLLYPKKYKTGYEYAVNVTTAYKQGCAVVSSNQMKMNTKLFVAAPVMIELLRDILYGHVRSFDAHDLLSDLRRFP